MRRVIGCALGATALIVGLALPAGAEKDTVQGEGPISKLSANNADNKIFVKVFSTENKNEVRWVDVFIKRKSDGKRYHAQAAWIGGDFYKSLSWQNDAPEDCDGFKFFYKNNDGSANDHWKVVIPRSCVGKLTPKIKVTADLVSNQTAQPGEAGPTEWLSKG